MSNLTTDLRRPPRRLSERKSRDRGWLIGSVLLLISLAAAWFGIVKPHLQQAPRSSGRRGLTNAATPVGVAIVKTGDLPITLRGLGTVTPPATVIVKTQVSGQLVQIGFKEGQRVKKGDFLAQIDPRIYQAQLEQYQGQLVRDQAQLANGELDLARYKKLSSQDSISHQTLDTQLAVVQQDEGVVQIDQGQVDNVKVNLAYCRIESPVDGQVGLRQVDEGNYVQTSDANGIVVVTQMQPITVIFTLPEDDVSRVIKRLHDGAVLPATAFDRSDTQKIAEGTLETTDNQVDTSTGTVKLRAIFANDKEELFPNQFVNVRLLVDTLHGATLLPVAALQTGTPGTYVYVVNAGGTASVRAIRVGPGDDQNVSVLDGISAGEKVVVDGIDRLRDGASITIPAAAGHDDAPSPDPRPGQSPSHWNRGTRDREPTADSDGNTGQTGAADGVAPQATASTGTPDNPGASPRVHHRGHRSPHSEGASPPAEGSSPP